MKMPSNVRLLWLILVGLSGCSSKLSGTYAGDGIPFKQLTFTSRDKVELTTVMGTTAEAAYVVDGEKVKISANGQTQVFAIDANGCLDGGGMIGKFCKQSGG